jgi:probable phosphoglycerate mutase
MQSALVVAQKLAGTQIHVIISSDLGRAFITAYIIAKEIGYQAEIIRDRQLREVSYGHELSNKPVSAYPKLSPEDNTNSVPGGGESLAQMQDRVLREVALLNEKYSGQTVLLVVHDGTINAIRASFLDQPIGLVDAGVLKEETNNPHDMLAKFAFTDGKVSSFL